ncbi:HD domain-containing protein [Alteribacter aurantiacus]|uniref:HD domain-containing protein n=1 Tax=Alteribacter aurantiacus TaxID=254410 RepID=UPI0004198CEF|nr:HD domain-containing protein [Alteribacter aurantiacus]
MDRTIQNAESWARSFFSDDATGHDWFHTHRVRNTALMIGEKERADLYVIELVALLHDVADDKFYKQENQGLNEVASWLKSHGVEEWQKLIDMISSIGFSSGKTPDTLEGKIVQDADRLEALGAIGIARTFMYAGAHGDAMYNPDIPVRENMTKSEYRKGQSTAINHFYEKLLKLKEKMNTKTGRLLAEERDEYMKGFLDQFHREWDSKIGS